MKMSRVCSVVLSLGLMLASACSIAMFSGCTSSSGYETFVVAADVAANQTIGPRYAEYVALDPALSVDAKVSYLNELAAFRATVAEAKRDSVSARGPPQ